MSKGSTLVLKFLHAVHDQLLFYMLVQRSGYIIPLPYLRSLSQNDKSSSLLILVDEQRADTMVLKKNALHLGIFLLKNSQFLLTGQQTFRIKEILYFISYLLVITEWGFNCELSSSHHSHLLPLVMIWVIVKETLVLLDLEISSCGLYLNFRSSVYWITGKFVNIFLKLLFLICLAII